MSLNKERLLISIASLLLFLPFIGSVHLFDWDEINFAESAREMLITGNLTQVQINFESFWEKPPLFFWLQSCCMAIFGVGEFAARLPNAIAGFVTIFILYTIGHRHGGRRVARLWALVYLASITPFFYFKSGIIDPIFNLFIFLAIYHLFRARISLKRHFGVAGLFTGLAVLTKGPVALLLIGLVYLIYLIKVKKVMRLLTWSFLGYVLTALSIMSLWFIPEMIKSGPGLFVSFLSYQLDLLLNPVASHGQPIYYHPIVLFFGAFPASVFALNGFLKKDKSAAADWTFVMKTLFWVVLTVFSLVTTKIVHYSSLCFIPLTYLAAKTISEGLFNRKYLLIMGWVVITIIGFALSFIPLVMFDEALKEGIIAKIADPFTQANMKVNVNWIGYEFIWGLLIIFNGLLMFRMAYKLRMKYLYGSLAFNGVLLMMLLATVVPKVEQHIQGPYIQNLKSISEQKCYITTFGFKSYAHYFYSRIQPVKNDEDLGLFTKNKILEMGHKQFSDLKESERKELSSAINHFLFTAENLDRPVYVVCKLNKVEEMTKNPSFEMIFNDGGYSMFRRR